MLTQGGVLCDEQGNLGPSQFEAAMRAQLTIYIQRQISKSLAVDMSSRAESVQLMALKTILLEHAKLQVDETHRDAQQEATSGRVEAMHREVADLRRELREFASLLCRGESGSVTTARKGSLSRHVLEAQALAACVRDMAGALDSPAGRVYTPLLALRDIVLESKQELSMLGSTTPSSVDTAQRSAPEMHTGTVRRGSWLRVKTFRRRSAPEPVRRTAEAHSSRQTQLAAPKLRGDARPGGTVETTKPNGDVTFLSGNEEIKSGENLLIGRDGQDVERQLYRKKLLLLEHHHGVGGGSDIDNDRGGRTNGGPEKWKHVQAWAEKAAAAKLKMENDGSGCTEQCARPEPGLEADISESCTDYSIARPDPIASTLDSPAHVTAGHALTTAVESPPDPTRHCKHDRIAPDTLGSKRPGLSSAIKFSRRSSPQIQAQNQPAMRTEGRGQNQQGSRDVRTSDAGQETSGECLSSIISELPRSQRLPAPTG